jgi:hypothetical protein
MLIVTVLFIAGFAAMSLEALGVASALFGIAMLVLLYS